MLVETDSKASFPFTFQISDIKEPEKRKGGHSTTLKDTRNTKEHANLFFCV